MRSRFVVEVLDDPDQVLPEPPAQPAPTQIVASDLPVFEDTRQEPALQVDSVQDQPKPVSPQRNQPDYGFKTLHSKLNSQLDPIPTSNLELPQVSIGKTDPPDLFDISTPRVQRVWQESTLRHAQEVPEIVSPQRNKRLKIEPEVLENPATAVYPHQDRIAKIEQLFSQKSVSQIPVSKNYNQPPRPPKTAQTLSQRRARRVIGISAIALCVVLGLVSVTASIALWDFRIAKAQALQLQSAVEIGRFDQALQVLPKLQRKTARYQSLFRFTRPVLEIGVGEEKAQNIDQLLRVSDNALRIVSEGADAAQTVQIASAQFFGHESGLATDTLASASGQLERLYGNLASFQAEVNALENPFKLEVIDSLKTMTHDQLPSLRRGLLSSQQILSVLPELSPATGKRQYLVLLQNNAELRPTGGFIGSIGILTLEHGRFVDFRIEDVYEADGQLNGYVEPPPELKKYLGEAQWFLRDVNWSADFPIVAEQSSWFLEKTLGIRPDGVIGLNLAVAQKILAATGPVEIPDYDEVITSENLYQRAQLHAEVNFFPGSTQKRDFLSAVANALFQKLTTGGAETSALLPALFHSVEESQLFMSTKLPRSAQVLQGLGWDGSVRTPECPAAFATGTCFVDTVMQVEANVGVNKSNQYLQRSVDHRVVLQDQMASHTRSISLTNTSTSNAWPQGTYKAYFRLYVAPNAQLDSITIDGQIIAPEWVDQSQEVGKQVFGVLVNVPVRSSSQIVVKYNVPLSAGWSSYALFEQKQSGTGLGATAGGFPSETLTHRFQLSSGQLKTVAPEPVFDGSQLVFTSERTSHEFMAIERVR